MDVADWLRSLGLERYQAAFREHEITAAVLPNLSADDLKELGIAAVGHRRRLLRCGRPAARRRACPCHEPPTPQIPDSLLPNVGRSA